MKILVALLVGILLLAPVGALAQAPLQLKAGGEVNIARSRRYSQLPVNGLRETTTARVASSRPP